MRTVFVLQCTGVTRVFVCMIVVASLRSMIYFSAAEFTHASSNVIFEIRNKTIKSYDCVLSLPALIEVFHVQFCYFVVTVCSIGCQ